jgi:protein SERAC1
MVKQRARPIIWVGHSLGGLVIKEAIIQAASNEKHSRHEELGEIYSATIGVVFLGTPHRGSEKGALAQLVAPTAKVSLLNPNTQLLESLTVGSHFLDKQIDDFVTVSKNLDIVCFYEELVTVLGSSYVIGPRREKISDDYDTVA